MIEIALFCTLVFLAGRGFIALRRESSIRREFGQSRTLDTLALALPLAPFVVLFGQRIAPGSVVFGLVGALFFVTLIVASRQRRALECAGTDRTKAAIDATSTITLASIVGVIYLSFVGIFVFVAHFIDSRHGSV